MRHGVRPLSTHLAALREVIKGAKPLSPIYGYRATKNLRRHYERLSRQHRNLLVTGDAACAFNPVYGQGMSAAAIGAETLEEVLRERWGTVGRSGRFQRRLVKATAGAWLLATGQDFRVRGVKGASANAATRLSHRCMDRVLEPSLKDLAVRRTLAQVFHMLKPPTAMFGLAVASKVLREAFMDNRNTDGSVTVRETPEAA